tara:strand:+ start:8126 stop:8977 length:852 start_codon:yes stop_codon:yes gene_type:complete
MLISKTICHQGLVREQNEDSYISNIDASLWLVADGVGGNVGGDIASQLAVQTADRHLRQGEGLIDSIAYANDAILSAVSKQPELQGMATTIVAAQFKGRYFELSWVGDSRAYLIDSNAMIIRQLSSDHNLANELFMRGDISQEELADHPGQHELTQALGQLSLANIPDYQEELGSDSILLMCSDGLSGVLTDKEVLATCCRFASLDKIADSLLSQVLQGGAPDNVTFTLIAWKEELDGKDEIMHGLGQSKQINKKLHMLNKMPLTWMVLSLVVLIMMILFYVD